MQKNKMGRSPFARVPTPRISSTPYDTRLAYTMREVASMLGVSERTIYTLIHSGRLPAFHVGRAVRISHTALLSYMSAEGAS